VIETWSAGGGPTAPAQHSTPSPLLARNTGLNLVGYVLPVVVAAIAIPYVIHNLGVEQFGLLSLAWVVLGYLSIFDLGVGRATVKFVSEAIGRGADDAIPSMLWTSLVFQLIFGCICGGLFAVAAPYVVHLLHISDRLATEAVASFRILGATVPFLISAITLRGFLEAFQRFDLVNAVRIPSTSMLYALPAVAVLGGLGLVPIMELLLISVIVTGFAYLALDLRTFPALRRSCIVRPATLWRLLRFGGWVSVSSVLVPILAYSDRLLIGALVSVAALAFYTVPYEIVSRLLVLPASFGTVLFPAFSRASNHGEVIWLLYTRGVKYLILMVGWAVVLAVILARPALRIWVGPAFADAGTAVLQTLAVGMLLNSVAQIGTHVIDGVGRPDLRAKIFALYLPIYIIGAYFSIKSFGIIGAAAAWSARSLVELAIFSAAVVVLSRARSAGVLGSGGLLRSAGIVTIFITLAWLAAFVVGSNGWLGIGAAAAASGVFAIVSWFYLLDKGERLQVLAAVRSGRYMFGRSPNAVTAGDV